MELVCTYNYATHALLYNNYVMSREYICHIWVNTLIDVVLLSHLYTVEEILLSLVIGRISNRCLHYPTPVWEET